MKRFEFDARSIPGVSFLGGGITQLLTADAVVELLKRTSFSLAIAGKRIIAERNPYHIKEDEDLHALCLNLGKSSVAREGFHTFPYLVSSSVLQELNKRLLDDTDGVRRVSSWPIERSFAYFDVSDFSKQEPFAQAFIIKSLSTLSLSEFYWSVPVLRDAQKSVEARLCIGDGFIFVLRSPTYAALFAGHLANLIERENAQMMSPIDFHYRASVHVGSVFCFWDIGRDDWNYIGDGSNGGNRVLTAMGKEKDDAVYISDTAKKLLWRESEVRSETSAIAKRILSGLQNRGRHSDKHGGLWRVYELSHVESLKDLLDYLEPEESPQMDDGDQSLPTIPPAPL